MKHSRKMLDNEKVTENIKIRRDIDPGWASALFVQLHGSIYCWKIDGKDIADATKLVNELLRSSLVWGTNGHPHQDHIWIGEGELIHELMRESHGTKNKYESYC